MEPGRPGCSSARRRIASCGTPCTPRSVEVWSVIVLPVAHRWLQGAGRWSRSSGAPEPHPRGLAPLRVEGEDREAARPGAGRRVVRAGELRDGRADDRDLRDVVTAVLLHRALAL